MTPVAAHHESVTSMEDSVAIDKPIAEVFDFYRNFSNLPKFLGDVMDVEHVGENTTRWTIQGPLGVKVHWTAVVTDAVENGHIFYETSSDVLKTRWKIYFTQGASPEQTIVREVMLAPGGKVTETALMAVGKDPVKELHYNLERLKQYLETGRVLDTHNAVHGKFDAQ